MADGWDWANLDEKQMALLKETEETLGADLVLAYRSGTGQADASMQPATLDESQMECLVGAEKMMDAVLVAYQSEN